jgi:hypothetical protein
MNDRTPKQHVSRGKNLVSLKHAKIQASIFANLIVGALGKSATGRISVYYAEKKDDCQRRSLNGQMVA